MCEGDVVAPQVLFGFIGQTDALRITLPRTMGTSLRWMEYSSGSKIGESVRTCTPGKRTPRSWIEGLAHFGNHLVDEGVSLVYPFWIADGNAFSHFEITTGSVRA